MMYTASEKLGAIEREVKYRKRVYPRWVEEGHMSAGAAAYQIAVLEDIANDYRADAAKERLL